MAEFKQVFNFISEEVISQGYSFDELIAWLGTRKEGGQALENWSLEKVKPQVAMWKAMKIVAGRDDSKLSGGPGSPLRNSLDEGDLEEDFVIPGEGFHDQQNADFDSNPLRLVDLADLGGHQVQCGR